MKLMYIILVSINSRCRQNTVNGRSLNNDRYVCTTSKL